jgi:mRNA interferase YafQ
MEYRLKYTRQAKKSIKLCAKRGYDMSVFIDAVETLRTGNTLPETYKPHRLHGDYEGLWECHLKPDWLLVWTTDHDELIIYIVDTGTHSDLFKK